MQELDQVVEVGVGLEFEDSNVLKRFIQVMKFEFILCLKLGVGSGFFIERGKLDIGEVLFLCKLFGDQE